MRFCEEHRHLAIYGEYLVRHTIRNYRQDAWNKFYVFDVVDRSGERYRYLPYEEYSAMLEGIAECIPPIRILENPTYKDIEACISQDTYLLEEGTLGEGVVAKNYNYCNLKGSQIWGKIVREDFKRDSKSKNKGAGDTFEELCVAETLDRAYVSKEFHKFTTDRGIEWDKSMTGEFLRHLYHEWWIDYSLEKLSSQDTVNVRILRKTIARESAKHLMYVSRTIVTDGNTASNGSAETADPDNRRKCFKGPGFPPGPALIRTAR